MAHPAETGSLSRKEREKIVRQQEIVQAARSLFVQKGYHDTTLEEIAQHAGFGKGTIYNYFSSKQELFFAILNTLIDEIEEVATRAVGSPDGNTRENLTAYAKAMISYSTTNSDLIHFLMRELIRTESDAGRSKLIHLQERARTSSRIVAGLLEKEAKAGNIRPLNAERLALFFDSMLRFYGLHVSGTDKPFTQDQIDDAAELIVSVFFDGVAARTVKDHGDE